MDIKRFGINCDSGKINGDLKKLDIELSSFAKMGFDYVEIPVHGVDCILNGALNISQVKKVKKILGRYDFKYSVHSPDAMNLMSRTDEEMHIKVFKATIDFAEEIGASTIVYHSSKVFFDEDSLNNYYYKKYGFKSNAELFELIKTEEIVTLRNLGEYAKDKNVTIAIENIWADNLIKEYCYGVLPEDLVNHIRRIDNDNVKITFDLGHAYLTSKSHGYDILEAVKLVKPWLNHVHIHDNFGRYDLPSNNLRRLPFGLGDIHLPLGWGEIPLEEIFKLLDSYDGVYLLELQARFSEYFSESLEIAKNFTDI